MKKSILFSVFAILLLASCRKSDNPKIPDLVRVPIPNFQLDATSDPLIQDPNDFNGKFTVSLYFKDDIPPQKMDIVVARNGNYTDLKTLKADITTFPVTVSVTGKDLATLFGIPVDDIIPGSFFEFGSRMTLKDGTEIPAFNEGGNSYGAGIVGSFKGEVPVLKIKAVCPLDLNAFLGDATISDPGFWEATYPVKVTLEGTDVLVITGFVEDPSAVLKVKIDLKSQKASVDKQVFAPNFVGYHNGAAAGTGDVDACNNKISLTLAFSVTEGSFGSYTITLFK